MTPPDTQGEGLVETLRRMRAHVAGAVGHRQRAERRALDAAIVTLSALPVPVGGIEPGDVEWLERAITWECPPEEMARVDRILSVLRGELGRLGPAALHAAAESDPEPSNGAS